MKLGYLHLGPPRHGLHRYGRLLAEEARRRAELSVAEEWVELEGDSRDEDRLGDAAENLAAADVVHVQYNRTLWGEGPTQLARLDRFFSACPAPVVCTFHDVYPNDPWAPWKRDKRLRARVMRFLRDQRRRRPERRAVRAILARASRVLVCFEAERDRLAGWPGAERISVLGHFVEERENLPPRDAARARLGVDGHRVVTLLGFIHPRKGHDLAIDALRLLPDDVLLVFAGAAIGDNERKLAAMTNRAATLGVADRLRVTGFIPEDEQERWLVATDLAVCPFRFFSASGSLTTWISASRPILCHDLPQVAEYRRVAADAFFTFAPYDAEAFAAAARAALDVVGGGPDPAIDRLRRHFALPLTFERHLAVYREAARR